MTNSPCLPETPGVGALSAPGLFQWATEQARQAMRRAYPGTKAKRRREYELARAEELRAEIANHG